MFLEHSLHCISVVKSLPRFYEGGPGVTVRLYDIYTFRAKYEKKCYLAKHGKREKHVKKAVLSGNAL